jgi:hypothetical protein
MNRLAAGRPPGRHCRSSVLRIRKEAKRVAYVYESIVVKVSSSEAIWYVCGSRGRRVEAGAVQGSRRTRGEASMGARHALLACSGAQSQAEMEVW